LRIAKRRRPESRPSACADVVPGCDYAAWAETEEELMELVVAHARTAHGIEEVTPEVAAKVQAAIEDV
jgi:predicted small metal-binding protein